MEKLDQALYQLFPPAGLSVFRFLTARACFVPAVQCSAESEDGSLYSLEVLRGTEWEIPYPGTRSRYSIKVSREIIAHQVEYILD